MLRWRLAGAVGIIIPVLGCLWLDDQANGGYPGVWFAPLAVLVGWLSCCELAALLRDGGQDVAVGATLGAATLGMVTAVVPTILGWSWRGSLEGLSWSMLGLAMAAGLVFCHELRQFQVGRRASQRLAATLLILTYVIIPFSFAWHLRMWSPDRLGLLAFVSLVFVAKTSDSGAYFFGRVLGRHPLAPRLSPKKTWEGGVGGLVSAVLAAIAFQWTIVPWFCPATETARLAVVCGYGLSIALLGVAGDLSISLFKREAQQKDSAHWLPGLGGVLDVVDSVLWSAPAAYLWWASGLLS